MYVAQIYFCVWSQAFFCDCFLYVSEPSKKPNLTFITSDDIQMQVCLAFIFTGGKKKKLSRVSYAESVSSKASINIHHKIPKVFQTALRVGT